MSKHYAVIRTPLRDDAVGDAVIEMTFYDRDAAENYAQQGAKHVGGRFYVLSGIDCSYEGLEKEQ